MAERTNRTLTFRVAITAAVLAIITALTASLTFIQLETFHAAARAAASAAMDAASANTLSRLEGDISELNSVVRVLSSNHLSPTLMTGARPMAQSLCLKLRCTSCRRPIVCMSVTTTVVGCKSDASMYWTRQSVRS